MSESKEQHEYGSPKVFYEKYYKSVIFGRSLGSRSVRKTHIEMEKPWIGKYFSQVLEIGGGSGEHISFVKHGYEKYFLTDINRPSKLEKFQWEEKIVYEIQDAQRLDYPNCTFDRVIVTCLLHHVTSPEDVYSEILRVLKPNGVATIFLSCDPGLAVRLLRKLTVARLAKKQGFEGYDLMISREHRNHISSLIHILRYVFRENRVKVSFYPFKIPSWNLNGFVVAQITK